MRKTWILFIGFMSTFCSYSQSEYAVINDPDGYLNVREKPGTQSAVIGQILEEEIFCVAEHGTANGWFHVNFMQEITEDMDKSDIQNILDGKVLRAGYVYGNRVRRLPAPEHGFMTNNDLSSDHFLAKDSLLIFMNIGQYQPRDSVTAKAMWGTDLNVPNRKITQAYLKVHDVRYHLPSKGFFEPNFSSTELIYDPQLNDFIITMNNSDGAGYYFCVWQVKDNGEVKRYAFQPY